MMISKNNVDEIISRRISNLLDYSNLNQTDIARLTNIDRTSISKIKSGVRKVSASELNKFAKIFNVPIDYLLGNETISSDNK